MVAGLVDGALNLCEAAFSGHDRPKWPMRVYVYNSTVPCTDARHGKDLYEPKLASLFLTDESRTHDPKLADIFYHPACLTDAFFRARAMAETSDVPKRARLGLVTDTLRKVEDLVLNDIAHVGFASMPHIVNALRCYTQKRRRSDGLAWLPYARAAYPRIWGSRRFFTFCGETNVATRVDEQRSIYMPYCPAAPYTSLPYRPDRPVKVLYIGTMGRPGGQTYRVRSRVLSALNRTLGPSDVRIVLLGDRSHKHSGSPLLELMQDAVLTLCPEGDVPESMRIYHALARGSIPLVSTAFHGPSFTNWTEISAPIRFTRRGSGGRGGRRGETQLALPSDATLRRLQANVWRHSHTFECERANHLFTAYVHSALRRLRLPLP